MEGSSSTSTAGTIQAVVIAKGVSRTAVTTMYDVQPMLQCTISLEDALYINALIERDSGKRARRVEAYKAQAEADGRKSYKARAARATPSIAIPEEFLERRA